MKNKCHINSLELEAAFFWLKAFCKNKTRLCVLLKLDNTTAFASTNKNGGISASCNKVAKDIWNWTKGQNVWITVSNVPGVKTTTADLRSRLFYDNKEWSLKALRQPRQKFWPKILTPYFFFFFLLCCENIFKFVFIVSEKIRK